MDINHLLNNAIQLSNGNSVKLPIEEIIIAPSLVDDIAEYLERLKIGSSILLVSDTNLKEIIADRLYRKIAKKFSVTSHYFYHDVKADMQHSVILQEKMHKVDLVVAVGSGTINDLCKYASAMANKPYVIIATAASMNGYASSNASLIVEGYRTSLKAQLPLAIYMDTDIIKNSPKRMLQSGIGDILCRSTAQADWLLSHYLTGSGYLEEVFLWLKPYEDSLLKHSDKVIKGDSEMILCLCRSLLLSGLGMWVAGGSYPASQGEHMIAHTMEMLYGADLPYCFHGEAIAVTTVTMLHRQYERIQNPADTIALLPLSEVESLLRAAFPSQIVQQSMQSYQHKYTLLQGIDRDVLPKALEKIAPHIPLPSIIEHALLQADIDFNPKAIGWYADQYQQAVALAPYTRDRVTFLDV